MTNAADKFFKRVRPDENGCLIWIGHVGKDGYGRLGHEGRVHLAHRFLFERAGLIGRGSGNGHHSHSIVMDHLCRNRSCVRPSHLEIVTHAENMRRSPILGQHFRTRTHCARGHAYDEANTRWQNGHRVCRACSKRNNRAIPREKRAEYQRRFRARKRAGVLARKIYSETLAALCDAGVQVDSQPPRVVRIRYGRLWIVERP